MTKALEILSKLPSHERESAFCQDRHCAVGARRCRRFGDRCTTLQDLAARCNFELQNYRDAAILYKPLTQSLSPAARRTESTSFVAGGAVLLCTSSTRHWAWSAPASETSLCPHCRCVLLSQVLFDHPLALGGPSVSADVQCKTCRAAVAPKPPQDALACRASDMLGAADTSTMFVEDRLELGQLSRQVLERLPWTCFSP